MYVHWPSDKYITTWKKFYSNFPECSRLQNLGKFPNAILVTGCQRSGTTILSRVITQCEGIGNYWFSPDDELDAALILSGYVDLESTDRYCFQTTYLNECYKEYYDYNDGFKILWVLRNPWSVVYSMINNWTDHGLNQLFSSCAGPYLVGTDKWMYKAFGLYGISKLRRACLSYNAKISQCLNLKKNLDSNQFMLVDYDELVRNKHLYLPIVFKFLDLSYKPVYADRIHARSIRKVDNLSKADFKTIEKLCNPIYMKAKPLVNEAAFSEATNTL